jgi:hypothetical protein
MHYAFDRWMDREHPDCPFERYADLFGCPNKSAYSDDGIIPKVGDDGGCLACLRAVGVVWGSG